ncbi:hypothethical protein [Ralstonia solanacearum PSI07]|uniref:Hypothethical protein n=1 Tax=blood disease bacterium R229 TaxID=741978 RepID=G2ZS82_9RALS|nr:hypothethical protein [Ralstonia solanacearum PSI07]CCA81904.1 hypothethical protein [blood disease bacterium R229]
MDTIEPGQPIAGQRAVQQARRGGSGALFRRGYVRGYVLRPIGSR